VVQSSQATYRCNFSSTARCGAPSSTCALGTRSPPRNVAAQARNQTCKTNCATPPWPPLKRAAPHQCPHLLGQAFTPDTNSRAVADDVFHRCDDPWVTLCHSPNAFRNLPRASKSHSCHRVVAAAQPQFSRPLRMHAYHADVGLLPATQRW